MLNWHLVKSTLMTSFCVLLLLNGWIMNAALANAPSKVPLLPGTEKCPLEYGLLELSGDSKWHESEIWAWNQICVGNAADFSKWPKEHRVCPPTNSDVGNAPIISSKFIKTLLGYQPFRNLVTQQGILIECALFPDTLTISDIRSPHRLWLDKSTFIGGVKARNLHLEGELSFDHSHFLKGLVLDRSRIRGALFLGNTRFDVPAPLKADGPALSEFCESTPLPCAIQALNVTIEENLSLTGMQSSGYVNAGGISVGGDVNLRKGNYGPILLNGAKVGGDINTCADPNSCSDGSTIKHLSLDGASVQGSVVLDGSMIEMGGPGIDHDVSVDLTATDIRNQLQMQNVQLAGVLKGEALNLSGNALLRNGLFGEINFAGAQFGGSVDLRGATFEGLVNLSNSTTRGTLILATPDEDHKAPVWRGGKSALTLQNAQVGSLQDWGSGGERYIYDDLKGKLDLTGFFYRQLGLAVPSTLWRRDVGDGGRLTGKERVERWLSFQRDYEERALPQPFEQLARALDESGYGDEGRYVRISSRDQSRTAAETSLSEKVLLFLQWIIIGYGYNTWISFVWLAFLVLIGGILGRYGKDLSTLSFGARLWYSLDSAIPLLELDDKHKQLNTGGVRGYFYCHKILGFLLASFLVAGLSGLTR